MPEDIPLSLPEQIPPLEQRASLIKAIEQAKQLLLELESAKEKLGSRRRVARDILNLRIQRVQASIRVMQRILEERDNEGW